MILTNHCPFYRRPARQHQEPLIHTLSAHVTKEKPIFIYILSPNYAKQDGSARKLSATVDLLWCVSLMYDDFVDQDQERSGKKAAWVQYGQERTMDSVNATLDTIARNLDCNFGGHAHVLCKHYIDRGILSIEEQKQLPLDCTLEDLISNYIKRAEFHTVFPLSLIYGGNIEGRAKALSAIEDLNIAGQILNDIKDLLPNYSWNRKGFSDVRNGLLTLPILHLLRGLDSNEQEIFKRIFGGKTLSEEESRFLMFVIRKTNALTFASNAARSYFARSLGAFKEVVGYLEFQYPNGWINYKLSQLPEITLD